MKIEFKRREIGPVNLKSPAQIIHAMMSGLFAKIVFTIVFGIIFYFLFGIVVVGVVNVIREAADKDPIPWRDNRWLIGYICTYSLFVFHIFRDRIVKR